MFWNKNKKYDDEIVVGKMKKQTKKESRRLKKRNNNEYYVEDEIITKDNEIRDKVEEILIKQEDFTPSEDTTTNVQIPSEFKPFPFNKEDVFGTDKTVEKEIEPTTKKDKKRPKDLKTYFEKDKKKQKKLLQKEESIVKDKETPKLSRRARRKAGDFTDVKEENSYRFGKKKFTKVEDFISYCTQNYLEIDSIAKKVLKDEKFHGWVSRRSGVYKKAFQEFKEIRNKIEK